MGGLLCLSPQAELQKAYDLKHSFLEPEAENEVRYRNRIMRGWCTGLSGKGRGKDASEGFVRDPETQCMRVLGAPVHMQADCTQEFDEIFSRAWKAFHAKAPLWRSNGHLHAKLRILHLGISPCFMWASGTRNWSATELQKLSSRCA